MWCLSRKTIFFFSNFYTAPPKVAFLIKQTQKGYLGLYLTASERATASQHGRRYHAVNERSTLGFSHRGTWLRASSQQSVWERRGSRQAGHGRAGSCCPPFTLYPCTSHMSCSHLILPLLLSPRPAWWEADRYLTAPFPGWGMMLSSFPQALVWEEEVGWEAGDGGR